MTGKSTQHHVTARPGSSLRAPYVAEIKGLDKAKSTLRNGYPPGTTSNIFLLKQGQAVQKIFIADNASIARESVIFQNGKPVLRQSQGPTSTWNYYFDGETSYLYFKEYNQLITDSRKFNYDAVEGHLRLFKDQINNGGN